jgi:signal transduction histidine kinase
MTTLVVTGDADILMGVAAHLPDEPLVVVRSLDELDAIQGQVSLALIADDLPGGGARSLRAVRARWPSLPAVLLGIFGRTPDVAAALRQGLCDYLAHDSLQLLPERVAEVRAEAMQARKLQEAAEDCQRYRLALEAGGLGFWDWEIASGAVRYVVDGERVGEDAVGPGRTIEHFLAQLHPEDAPGVREALYRAVEGEGRYVVQFRSRWLDGSVSWSDSRGQVIRDADGHAVRMVGIETDITEQERLRDALRAAAQAAQVQAAELEAIFQLAPIGLAVWDTSPEHRCLRHNSHILALFGKRAAGRTTLVRATLAELVGPEIYPQVEAVYQHVIATGEQYIVEDYEWRETPESPVRSYIWTLAPLRDQGGVIQWLLSTAVETTVLKDAEQARIHMERRMLESQKLESIGLLAGGVAHDLNNMLNVVLGNLELLRLDPTETSRERYLERIERAAQHSAELMRQLLNVAGRSRSHVEAVHIGRLAQELSELLRTSIPGAVVISLGTMPDLPAVRGDAGQLRQVVMNLIMNAAEAIGEQPGRIMVSTRVRHASEEFLREAYLVDGVQPGTYVALEVSDSGKGMDEATLGRIFEPFYTTKPRGRGLGLAAVLGIVRSHGGALRVWSAPGAGTIFTVLLPPLQESR